MIQTIFIHADNHLLTRVDAGLCASRSFFDTHLGHSGFDGLGHTAERLNFLDVFPSLVGNLLREFLHIVRTGPRVDFAAYLSFILNEDLGIAGNTSREVGRQGDSLVKRVGMERLGVAQYGSHSLYAGTSDVVERILLRE